MMRFTNSVKRFSTGDLVDQRDLQIDLPEIDESYAPFRRSSMRRSINKKGQCALHERRIQPSCFMKYVKDPFTTLIDYGWWTLIFFYVLSFLVSWYLFALLWWMIAYYHGDTDGSPYKAQNVTPCITELVDFPVAFIFSLETQTSIGFGNRAPTTECPEATVLLSAQSIFGAVSQAIAVGVIFAKLSRPNTRSQFIQFSKNAVICERNNEKFFMIRIGDTLKSLVTGCKIKAWLIETKTSNEGILLTNYTTKINISVDDGGSHFFLLWPVIITHKIDDSSPLNGISLKQMTEREMEIVISLFCTSESTAQEIEIRRSYTPQNILLGHRFKNVVQMNKSKFIIDYANFDLTEEIPISDNEKLSSSTKP